MTTKTTIRALLNEARAANDTHQQALCEIALWCKVQPATMADLSRSSKSNLATSYGIGYDGTTQLANAAELAAKVCEDTISHRRED